MKEQNFHKQFEPYQKVPGIERQQKIAKENSSNQTVVRKMFTVYRQQPLSEFQLPCEQLRSASQSPIVAFSPVVLKDPNEP